VFPIRVAWLWSATGATERLRARLRSSGKLDLQAMLSLQRETHNAEGPKGVRKLLKGIRPRSTAARQIYTALRDWDGSTGPEARGAAVYHAFRMRLVGHLLRRRLPSEQIDALLALAEPVPGQVLARYLEQIPDRVETSLVHAALEETWSWLASEVSSNPSKWTWGQAHRLRLSHAFERLGGGLTRLVGRSLGRGPFEAPGDPASIWAMFSSGAEPFRPRVGPAFRFAVDLADPVHARFGLAGGQSGLPGAPGYADGIEDWLSGRPRVLWMHAADLAYHGRGTWELRPGPP
jgi:penicillin amidase